ncbi:MAG: branched-chain amino acid transport permease [Naasia sp.]|nr:branched-chain amino acid transport permease [Naasia sp.]
MLRIALDGLSFGSLLFIAAIGMSLSFGVLRLVNLAHGGLFMLGAYLASSLLSWPGGWVTAIFGSAVAVGLLGLAIERGLLRYFRTNHLAQVLITLGIVFILHWLTLAVWGGAPLLSAPPEIVSSGVSISGQQYPVYRLALIGFGLVMFVAIWLVFSRTRYGAMVRATVDDEQMARGIGLRSELIGATVFAVGAALAGMAGAIGLPYLGAYPGLDGEVLLFSLIIIIIGGAGSILGSFIAAITVGLINAFTAAYLPFVSSFVLFAVMIVLLIFRPYGLLGREIVASVHLPQSDGLGGKAIDAVAKRVAALRTSGGQP